MIKLILLAAFIALCAAYGILRWLFRDFGRDYLISKQARRSGATGSAAK